MKISPALLLGFVLANFATAYVDATASEATHLYQYQPLLVDSKDQDLGLFVGTTVTHNEHGAKVKAFAYLTAQGYLIAMRPGGIVGSANSVYFASENCRGAAYLLAENSADVADSYLPGIVIAFEDPANLYAIKKNTEPKLVTFESRAQATDQGVTCSTSTLQGQAYRLRKNDPIETGVSSVNHSRVHIEVKSIREESVNNRRTPFKSRSDDTAIEPFNLNQEFDSCSPGCESDLISNGICEPECNVSACGYDSNDCSEIEIQEAMQKEEAQCAPLCELQDLGDGFCDRACNNAACNYDNGDCPFN